MGLWQCGKTGRLQALESALPGSNPMPSLASCVTCEFAYPLNDSPHLRKDVDNIYHKGWARGLKETQM